MLFDMWTQPRKTQSGEQGEKAGGWEISKLAPCLKKEQTVMVWSLIIKVIHVYCGKLGKYR